MGRGMVTAIRRSVAGGEQSAVELTRQALHRAHAEQAALGAFLHIDDEQALSHAARIDERRDKGEALGPLAGVPVAVKDNICTRGMPTTCASRILEGYTPPYDAHVVKQLRRADAVIIGKTNMDEFAMGSSTENSAFHLCRNPWDTARSPGGSSGGSAAATSAQIVPVTLGSDTGGSVRQPAAFCGVTALKPTYGRVSRYGLIAFASSLDQIGPITRGAEDAALVLDAIAGHDPRDATSLSCEVSPHAEALKQPFKPLKIGILRSTLGADTDPEVSSRVEDAISTLSVLGCEAVDVELEHARYAVATYYLIAPAEASSNLARFDGMRYGKRVTEATLDGTYQATRQAGFGPEVKRRIMLGAYALSSGYYDAYYLKAQKVRTLIRRDFEAAFAQCDVVLSPTSPTPAFALGSVPDPLSMYMADIFTLPASLAGLPAISLPCGLSDTGLPVSLHLVGPALKEDRLLSVAQALEQHAPFNAEPPSVHTSG